jgi:hypothetical protein
VVLFEVIPYVLERWIYDYCPGWATNFRKMTFPLCLEKVSNDDWAESPVPENCAGMVSWENFNASCGRADCSTDCSNLGETQDCPASSVSQSDNEIWADLIDKSTYAVQLSQMTFENVGTLFDGRLSRSTKSRVLLFTKVEFDFVIRRPGVKNVGEEARLAVDASLGKKARKLLASLALKG